LHQQLPESNATAKIAFHPYRFQTPSACLPKDRYHRKAACVYSKDVLDRRLAQQVVQSVRQVLPRCFLLQLGSATWYLESPRSSAGRWNQGLGKDLPPEGHNYRIPLSGFNRRTLTILGNKF